MVHGILALSNHNNLFSISDQKYLSWQKRLASSKGFRRFWVFCGIYCTLIVFILGLYLFAIGEWRIDLIALAAFIFARGIISPAIYLIYKRQRPYQKLDFVTIYSWLFSPKTSRFASFPSDHAMSMASISFVLCWFNPEWAVLLVVLTFVNGIGRVVLGYHYISDVLAGWILGAICGFLMVNWLAPLLFTR